MYMKIIIDLTIAYFVLGFLFYKVFCDRDVFDMGFATINISKWKRVHRILLRFGFVFLWPIYVLFVLCIFGFIVILCLKEEIIKFFK